MAWEWNDSSDLALNCVSGGTSEGPMGQGSSRSLYPSSEYLSLAWERLATPSPCSPWLSASALQPVNHIYRRIQGLKSYWIRWLHTLPPSMSFIHILSEFWHEMTVRLVRWKKKCVSSRDEDIISKSPFMNLKGNGWRAGRANGKGQGVWCCQFGGGFWKGFTGTAATTPSQRTRGEVETVLAHFRPSG
jgi:hypothetical protein